MKRFKVEVSASRIVTFESDSLAQVYKKLQSYNKGAKLNIFDNKSGLEVVFDTTVALGRKELKKIVKEGKYVYFNPIEGDLTITIEVEKKQMHQSWIDAERSLNENN